MQEAIDPPPSATGPDKVGAVLRALVSEFPGGGIIVSAYEQIFGTELARRQESWLRRLYELLVELHNRDVDLGELGRRPEFLTAIRDANRVATGEYLEEKLDMLKAILFNLATGPPDRVADLLALRYLQWVDEMEPEHIAVLRHCARPPATLGRSPARVEGEPPRDAAEIDFIEPEILALVASDLEARGLIHGRGIREVRTPGGPVQRTGGSLMYHGGGEVVRGEPVVEPVASDLSNAWILPPGRRFLDWLLIA